MCERKGVSIKAKDEKLTKSGMLEALPRVGKLPLNVLCAHFSMGYGGMTCLPSKVDVL